MTCPFGTMDWYCCLAAGHAGPHESHELPPDTSTNPPSVPSLDVEAQPDPPKLESRADLHRTATQPEKEGLAAGSGTSLDVEACVRLLNLMLRIAGESMPGCLPNINVTLSIDEFAQFRALASALPGMGKDSDEFREACRAGGIACAGERDAARTDGRFEDAREWERFANVLHARAAQPEETSADERP